MKVVLSNRQYPEYGVSSIIPTILIGMEHSQIARLFFLKNLTVGGVRTEHFTQSLWDGNGRGFILVAPDKVAAVLPVSQHLRRHDRRTGERRAFKGSLPDPGREGHIR